MRLDELPWRPYEIFPEYGYACFLKHSFYRSPRGTYTIALNCRETMINTFPDREEQCLLVGTKGWENIDELTAQCVLYELLKVT